MKQALIRPLRCRATHPQIDDCAISIPLQKLLEDREAFENLCDFTDTAVSHSGAVAQILEVITKVALPFLEGFCTLADIRNLVSSDLAPRCKISEEARKALAAGKSS